MKQSDRFAEKSPNPKVGEFAVQMLRLTVSIAILKMEERWRSVNCWGNCNQSD
ncbi:MAG: hypothetical protein QNJ34_28655 [Xenococcaceae cyanobacterium MO_188.B29]|nr:hypothetical protein [Xenococcaceae cyanobacterium MO_188.B29]